MQILPWFTHESKGQHYGQKGSPCCGFVVIEEVVHEGKKKISVISYMVYSKLFYFQSYQWLKCSYYCMSQARKAKHFPLPQLHDRSGRGIQRKTHHSHSRRGPTSESSKIQLNFLLIIWDGNKCGEHLRKLNLESEIINYILVQVYQCNQDFGWQVKDIIIAGPAGGKGIPDVKFSHKNNATQRLLVALNEGKFIFAISKKFWYEMPRRICIYSQSQRSQCQKIVGRWIFLIAPQFVVSIL